MGDVHLQVEMADHGHETVLFLVQAKDVFFHVEAELKLVTALLDLEHILRSIKLIVQVQHRLDPLVEDFALLLRQTRLQLFACLAQLGTFLLALPVLT